MIETHAGHFIRVLGRKTLASRIDIADVERYIGKREAEGATSHTVFHELSSLRGALRGAQKRREFRRDLAEVFPDYARQYEPSDRHATLEGIRALCAELEPDRRAVVAFIAMSAADLKSVWAARRSDLDLKNWRVLVRGSKTAHRHRTVPIVEQFRELAKMAEPYLPFRRWGNVRRDLASACKRAGIPYVSPRDLRRSTGKILRALGVHPNLIAPVMGHADGRMVERVYGRVDVDDLQSLLDQSTRQRRQAPAKRQRRATRFRTSKKEGQS